MPLHKFVHLSNKQRIIIYILFLYIIQVFCYHHRLYDEPTNFMNIFIDYCKAVCYVLCVNSEKNALCRRE